MDSLETTKLSEGFAEYLKAGQLLPSQQARRLAVLLAESGFALEAEALEACCVGIREIVVGNGPWRGRTMSLSPTLPVDAKAGDLWFDRVEIMPTLFFQNPRQPTADMDRWATLNPVRTWQFEGFRLAAKKVSKVIQWETPADYFLHPVSTDAAGFTGNIYQDEALAYSGWFGKVLLDQLDLQDIQDSMGESVVRSLVPPGRLLWDGSDFALSEQVRIATSSATVYADTYDEYRLWCEGLTVNKNVVDRTVFDEWDRFDPVGLSTVIWARDGLGFFDRRTLFFELQNSARRIEGFL